MIVFRLLIFSALLATGQQPTATTGSPEDAKKPVVIRTFAVEGTRFPTQSVVRLTELKAGATVTFADVYKAMQRVTSTGLIDKIDFEYESLPDKVDEVMLRLKCRDTKPIVPASVKIAGVEEDKVWKWLQQIDPLFTGELPPVDRAIRFYEAWLTKYMEANGQPEFREKFAIGNQIIFKNSVPERVVFNVITLKSIGKPKRK